MYMGWIPKARRDGIKGDEVGGERDGEGERGLERVEFNCGLFRGGPKWVFFSMEFE
jgi:hypothetical protein